MSHASDRLAAIDRSMIDAAWRLSQQRGVVAELAAEARSDATQRASSDLCKLEQSLDVLHARRLAVVREMGNTETSYYGA